MRKKPIKRTEPARWERWGAALSSLLLVFIPPIATIVGYVGYLCTHKRHPLFGRHLLHITLWNLLYALLFWDTTFIALLRPTGRVSSVIFGSFASRQDAYLTWHTAPVMDRSLLVFYFGINVINLAVIIWSIVAVLRRRSFHAPIMNWLLPSEHN